MHEVFFRRNLQQSNRTDNRELFILRHLRGPTVIDEDDRGVKFFGK
jgi:hypothetical protein